MMILVHNMVHIFRHGQGCGLKIGHRLRGVKGQREIVEAQVRS